MSESDPVPLPQTEELGGTPEGHEDAGGILIFVLMTVVICSLIVIPMLSYTTTVIRAGYVQSNRAEAVELANGGTWVALSNERQLYDLCAGGVGSLPSSLDGVNTTCQLLDTATLRPPTEMPFHVATVQADTPLPSALVTPDTYANPNTSADESAWLTSGQWSTDPTENTVWVPQLPVQATSSGGNRMTTMLPNTMTPPYTTCDVFFPGTFTDPITLDGPTYFTSGVYYFTEPITLTDGADVVVGNGTEIGCTTDFEAISFASSVPDPLNMSGLGGTFVLGERARITVADDGTGDIRFAINQRYVSTDETSVAASSDVAIVSVNGQHEPFLAGEALGQDFLVPGTSAVPASTVGTEGDPLATDSDYLPSVLTVKPVEPDAPVITDVEVFQEVYGNSSSTNDGMAVVTWDVPNNNGSLITGYVATDATTGQTCSPAAPTLPDTTVQPSCTIFGLSHQNFDTSARPSITVTATNGYGTSVASASVAGARVDLAGTGQTPVATAVLPPVDAGIGSSYIDGVEVTWSEPVLSGLPPITGYRVTAVDVTPAVGGATFSCEARWDEASCVLPLPPIIPVPPATAPIYDIEMVAVNDEGVPSSIAESPVVSVASSYVYVPTGDPSPVKVAATAAPRVPSPIVDFTTSTGTRLDVKIDGYVSVPQGRVAIGAADPTSVEVSMTGGVLAGEVWIDPAGPPNALEVTFDNPVAQKRVRLRSTYDGAASATSDAIVQVNRSGSLAINSWVVQ